ncbi:MAG: fdhA, partial [Betaproteobacteria bacterium]|nr:fdhA [Betaproteobacteria bacterium]
MLTRKSATTSPTSRLTRNVSALLGKTIDRRTFLKRSGITLGAGAVATQLPFSIVEPAKSAETPPANTETRHTVCTHCSVGCAVDAVVQNGVWTRQEAVFDSPINLGSHCAKGAAVREHGMTHDSRRLKYPVKLVNGKYQRISWDEALNGITAKIMQIRKESGPDSAYFVGSSKHNNEQAILMRKFVSLWGTNNVDHQARICHSTTVAGVANTWGYGAMTNSYNDEHHSKVIFFLGSNAAEAHPVSMLHTLHAKENGAKIIVVDPRFTRTAAHAHKYVRIRSGTDIAFIHGMLYHIFKNGWEDKAYIDARVYGMDKARAEAMKWTPDAVKEVTGIDEADVLFCAQTMAQNKPSTLVWAMGQTQHTTGSAVVRASCIFQLALGNVGVVGGGTNIYRGHDNVQGATDVGPNADSLPGYYGLATGSWQHWARVWNIDYDWLKGRFASQELMEKPGITVSRWIDGVLENSDVLDQPANIRSLFFWGHAPNSQTRGLEMKTAMDKLDLLVVVDPYPSVTAAMAAMPKSADAKYEPNPNREVYLLPAASQFETEGSVTASNRSLQWRERVIDPLFESRSDQAIMYAFAQKWGFADELLGKRNGTQNIRLIKVKNYEEPFIEDILANEINRGCWSIGYTGQTPQRLQAHMRNRHLFDPTSLRAPGGKDALTGYDLTGDYYGLPWPCYGKPELKHPGTHVLYDTSKNVMDGGGNFRANFGVERDGVSLLAADG